MLKLSFSRRASVLLCGEPLLKFICIVNRIIPLNDQQCCATHAVRLDNNIAVEPCALWSPIDHLARPRDA